MAAISGKYEASDEKYLDVESDIDTAFRMVLTHIAEVNPGFGRNIDVLVVWLGSKSTFYFIFRYKGEMTTMVDVDELERKSKSSYSGVRIYGEVAEYSDEPVNHVYCAIKTH